MILPRRKLLRIGTGLLAAPAIIRPSQAWFPHGVVPACPAPAAPQYLTTSGDPLLDNSRFIPFVKFFGDAGNNGIQCDQAYSGPLILTPPWFAIGFEVCLDYVNFGALMAYRNIAAGGMPLAFHGAAIAMFNHDGGEVNSPVAAQIFNSGGSSTNFNQWSCVCVYVPDTVGTTANIILDGVTGTTGVPWNGYPPPLNGVTLGSVSFGSWTNAVRGSMSDADCLQGGLRDWAVVQGTTPTLLQFESFRNNSTLANARSLWGSSMPSGSGASQTWSNGVIGYWSFTSDPRAGGIAANATMGATEPDLTGNGGTLTYFNGSSDVNGVLPQLMTCQT